MFTENNIPCHTVRCLIEPLLVGFFDSTKRLWSSDCSAPSRTVYVNSLDVYTIIKLPEGAFLKMYPCCLAMHDLISDMANC